MFKNAIVQIPCKNMVNGITEANLGKPDYQKALHQHSEYISTLKKIGLDVTILEPDDNFPDSTFVEDVAVLTPKCAIITNPGAKTRKDEIFSMKKVIKKFYKVIEEIKYPGTLDGGDVMMVGSHFYIGISERTNIEGANQLIKILEKHDLSGSTVNLKTVLHLKTGVSYLENNNLLAYGEFLKKKEFEKFNIIKVSEEEGYAANCIWVNNFVLLAKGFPKTKEIINNAGIKTIELDMSEFQKLDGGLSCLSLRF